MKEMWGVEPIDYAASDSIGEVLEKLAILHIRTWHLEDAMQEAKTDAELADLKRKVDICFKVKRPKLVAALNAIIDDAILKSKSLREDSVKLYKGVE
jgi:predicted small metal-binding protein